MPKAAFTLLELLIVITIIAILSAAIVPVFNTSRREAEIAKTKADLDTLAFAGRQAFYDTKHYVSPTYLDDDTYLSLSTWKGPYMPKVNADPWGTVYAGVGYLGSFERFYYCSCGPNKTLESSGENGTMGDDICVMVAGRN